MSPSPNAFRLLFFRLQSELTRCYELCIAVRQNRRIGNKHEALDGLEEGLASTISSLQIEYDTLYRIVGSRMDLGDEVARSELNHTISALSNDIRTRLEDVAYKRESSDGYSQSSRGRRTRPGFNDLARKLNRLEAIVEDTLACLSHRLDPMLLLPATPEPKVKLPKKPAHSKEKHVLSLQEVDRMMAHMKRCWEEQLVDGNILYVNCWDSNDTQWEKPEGGFIKGLGLKSKRSWERLSPVKPPDTWSTAVQGGWY